MKNSKYILIWSLLFLPLSLSAGSYSKDCSDGVCTINDNGKISYTGDPAKIAEIKAEKNKQVKMQKKWNRRWKKAPKKGKDEVIRVAIMRPTASDSGLKSLRKNYHKMIIEQYKNRPGIEVVPWDKIKGKLKMLSSDADDNRRGKNKKGKYEFYSSKESIQDMRNFGLKADFVVFTHLSPKSKTGFVKGSKLKEGAVIKTSNVEFKTTTTPLYKYKPKDFSYIGRSTGSISGTSWKKGSKSKKGTFKSKRRIEHDKHAIASSAANAGKRILKWRTHLPSKAASEKLYAAQRKEMFGDMPEGLANFAEALTENGGEIDDKKALSKGLKSLFGN